MMKKKKVKILILLVVVFSGILGLAGSPKVNAANNCKVNIAFDVNPKTDRFNQPLTLSGYINFAGSTFNPPGTPNAGYCNDSNGDPVKSAIISFTDDGGIAIPGITLTIPQNVNSNQISFSASLTPSAYGSQPGTNFKITAQALDGMAVSSPVAVTLTNGVYATYGCQLSSGLYACSPGGLSDCSDASACQGQKCVQVSDSNACKAIYACVASNGAYACTSSAGDSTCGSAAGCASGAQCTQIPLTMCGQTPNSTSNPGAGPSGTTNPGSSPGVTTNPGASPGVGTPSTPPVASIDCSQAQNANSPNCLYNPLPTTDLITFILLIMKWLLGVIGIIAVLFIMIGGFKMVTAQGAEEAVTAARKTITWAVIGLVVAVLSFSMIAIVENILQANIKNNTSQSIQKTLV